MSTIVRSVTAVLVALSMGAGTFSGPLRSLFDVQDPITTEFRLLLIGAMPILLVLAFLRVNQQPAKTLFVAATQSIGLIAIFSAPFFWLARQA
ncbi:hypothetical protein [Roseateles sp. LYH14W]|uniref:EamA/RhaT family transporter n=1 Tax=Pelomonas parva TaxID=3299032 RepID=A0ABW7F4X4_9BURK